MTLTLAKVMEVVRGMKSASLCLDNDEDIAALERLLIANLELKEEPTSGRKVSVAFALREICDAVQGCRLLASTWEAHGFDNERERREVPAAIAALLSLINLYTENWSSVLLGGADPRIVWTARNAATSQEDMARDLVLSVWEGGEPDNIRFAEDAGTRDQPTSNGAPSKEHRKRSSTR